MQRQEGDKSRGDRNKIENKRRNKKEIKRDRKDICKETGDRSENN